MEIDRRSFRQQGSRLGAGYSDNRPSVTLVADRSRALESISKFGIETSLEPIFCQRVILLCSAPLQNYAFADLHFSWSRRRNSISAFQQRRKRRSLIPSRDDCRH